MIISRKRGHGCKNKYVNKYINKLLSDIRSLTWANPLKKFSKNLFSKCVFESPWNEKKLWHGRECRRRGVTKSKHISFQSSESCHLHGYRGWGISSGIYVYECIYCRAYPQFFTFISHSLEYMRLSEPQTGFQTFLQISRQCLVPAQCL